VGKLSPLLKHLICNKISRRVNLEEELRELRETLGKARGVEEELRKSVSELQKRALNAETQMLLTNGEKDKQETEVRCVARRLLGP